MHLPNAPDRSKIWTQGCLTLKCLLLLFQNGLIILRTIFVVIASLEWWWNVRKEPWKIVMNVQIRKNYSGLYVTKFWHNTKKREVDFHLLFQPILAHLLHSRQSKKGYKSQRELLGGDISVKSYLSEPAEDSLSQNLQGGAALSVPRAARLRTLH